jgi:hypothetical protein
VSNADLAAGREILEKGFLVLKAPFLVGEKLDPFVPDNAGQVHTAQGLVPNLMFKEIEASHWLTLEKLLEYGEAITEWLLQR